MKKTNAPSRLLAVLLSLVMIISVLPVNALAAEMTASAPQGRPSGNLSVSDAAEELTDSDRLSIFEENMDKDVVSESDIPAEDETVKVIVSLDEESLLDVRNRLDSQLSMSEFQQTAEAQTQLQEIARLQSSVMSTMESEGIRSSVSFSYTSLVSGFSAEVAYGDIDRIKDIDGVVDVVLCQTYYPDVMGEATLGEALSAAEVAAYANNTEYQGEGILIGILDTGLDTAHEAFANAPAVQKLQKSSLEKLLYTAAPNEQGGTTYTAYSYAALWYAQANSTSTTAVLLTADDLYKSAKVPFGFDYADADAEVIPSAKAVESYGNDHGTHVAGIAAGKTVDEAGNVTFAGQSPEAQLAIFKVFSDAGSGASTDTILAALNDAMLLDVDVINMSLGSSGGFGREEEDSLTTKYYDLVKSCGILLNCSAGNAYSSSQGGAQGDFTSVSDPDTGIISASSSYDAALSVASVNANETAAFLTTQGRVPYQDVSGYDFAALLLENETSKTLDYVMVPGTGDVSDYEGLDVSGKIVLVMRGGLSFEQKQLNAADAGAAGCIIYNNRDGYLLNMAIDNYRIPTACISLSNGQMMAEAETKTLTVSSTEKGAVAMSDFSSWGPLPSLELKPEITAPGGSIYSSLPFGTYGYMSGTSMASPYLAGTAAAALQYVNSVYSGASDTEKQILVNRLLMSTAGILYDDSGVAYSPRKQGAGLVNLSAAISTPAYLYVQGQEKTKIELGDDALKTGVYQLSFTVQNMTGSALSYDVATQVQTETPTSDGLYIAQQGHVLSADTSAIRVSGGSLSGSTVTVPANGKATVTVTVKLTDADREYLAQFPNGIYVEGFVELTNDNDPSLSVPFLGFYGDWTKAPILEEADAYNGKDVKMFATTPTGLYGMMYVLPLGTYPFVLPEGYTEPAPSADNISVGMGGGNGISSLYYLQAGMLRAAKTADVVIKDRDTGELLLNASDFNDRKAMYNSSSGTVRAGYVGQTFPALSGGGIIPNNTRLNYSYTAYIDGYDVQDNLNNTYSFDVTADGEMPYIVNRDTLAFRRGDDGRMYLDLTLADNFRLCGASLYSTTWSYTSTGQKQMSPGNNYYDGIFPAVKDDGTVPGSYEPYTFTFDVTDFYQDLLEGTFYVLAYDYAMNQCAYRVTLPENPITEITLSQTALTLPIKGYATLEATVIPDDATDQNLTWSTSDSSVATVKNGIVVAVGTGSATITVKSNVWTDVKAECQVTVTEEVGPDVTLTGIQLNRSSISMLAGTTNTDLRLSAYAPFYATDLELVWLSSDESIVTAEPNGTGDTATQTAKLTAYKPGTAIVTAKAKNSDASFDVTVTVGEASGEGTFSIVGDTLVAYSGTAATVTIPEGVRVIGEKAFNNNDYLMHLVCPDSLEEIGTRAFYDCDNLQTVQLPATLKVVGEGAFYGCENMTTLGYADSGVVPQGLTTISKQAFYNCKALTGDVVIPEGVTTLGDSCFASCAALTGVTMSDSVTEMNAGGYQFSNCKSITFVRLSKNLQVLPNCAFFTCSSLTQLPDLSNVTSMGTSCFASCGLTEIVIPENITMLGNNAFGRNAALESVTIQGDPKLGTTTFAYCSKLTGITAPQLTTVGKQMFQNCTGLTNFVMPNNITTMGDKVFDGCTALTTVTFPASYQAATLSMGQAVTNGCKAFTGYTVEEGSSAYIGEDGALYVGKTLVSLPSGFSDSSYTVPEGIEAIGGYVFYKQTNLTSISLPASLKAIGAHAFDGCTKLTDVTMPDGLTTLGEYAFNGCSGLKTVSFGKSLTAVEQYSFYGCSALTAVELPATVESIGKYAFYNCKKVTTLSLEEGLTTIGERAFYACNAVTNILLPQSLTSIGTYAFYACNAATEINCGGLTAIPDNAFYGCKKATSITMSDDVTSVGRYSFYQCSVLETMQWPSQLTTVGDNAFYQCYALDNLDLSGTQIVTIGSNSFRQAYAAKTLLLPDTLESIGNTSFAYLNYGKTGYITTIHIPAALVSINKGAFDSCTQLQNFTVDENNPVYMAQAGVLMLKETGDIYIWPQANATTEFTIPSSMTEIPAGMFKNNASLKKIVIPATVTKVGDSAFSGAKVEEIYFEDSANGLVIGNSVFSSCTKLTSLRLPYGLTAMGGYAIQHTALETLVLPDTLTTLGSSSLAYNDQLKSITLSKSLTEIPNFAFVDDSALTELTIPASVQSCGITSNSTPFNNCTSLVNIYVAPGSRYFKSVDGVLFDANGATLRYYPEGRTAERYDIPEGVARVGARAFIGNEYLRQVSLPSTLQRIGNQAFYACTNLKDYYFNSLSAPLLETNTTLTGALSNVALYGNFVGLWCNTNSTGGVTFNDYGLNLYYLPSATGFDAYVWDKYFNTENGSVNVMDESFFTPTELSVTELAGRNALLTWTAARKSNAEPIVYTVERSVAVRMVSDTQDTWLYDGFETLAEGLTECSYTDTTALPFGQSYAYRVTAYSLSGETGPAAIACLTIEADAGNADEMAALPVIQAIEALKPIDDLTAEDETMLRELLAQYEALTETQQALVSNYDTLLAALELVGHNFGDWTITTEPTCEEEGEETRTCAVCGEIETRPVAALGHEYEDGSCTRCGQADPDYVAAPVVSSSIVASTGKIRLSWSAVDNAARYVVYRSASRDGAYQYYYSTTYTSFTNISVQPGETWYYKVKAVSDAGVSSDFSNVAWRTADCAAPVVSSSVVAETGSIRLDWNAVDGAERYVVYRSASRDGAYQYYYSTTNTSFINVSVQPGETWYYKVKAVCAATSYGDSALSNVAWRTADCAAPVVSIRLNGSGVPQLNWSAVNGADRYAVYRSTDGVNFSYYYTTTLTSFTNISAVSGQTYYYQVKALCAVSSYGDSARSAVVSIQAK